MKASPLGVAERLRRAGGERRHEKAKGEGGEELDGAARHGRFLNSLTYGAHSTRHVTGQESKFCRLNRAKSPNNSADYILGSTSWYVRESVETFRGHTKSPGRIYASG